MASRGGARDRQTWTSCRRSLRGKRRLTFSTSCAARPRRYASADVVRAILCVRAWLVTNGTACFAVVPTTAELGGGPSRSDREAAALEGTPRSLSGRTILLPVACRVHPLSSTTRSCTHPCTPVIAALAALRPPSPTTAATSRRGWSQAGAAELHEHKVGSHRSHRTVTARPLRLVARRVAASGR